MEGTMTNEKYSYRKVTIADTSTEDPWIEFDDEFSALPEAWWAFLRYTERIYVQLLFWIEVKEAIARMRKMGMGEEGIINKTDKSGQMMREMNWLHMLSHNLLVQAATAVKESYATTMGRGTSVRSRVSAIWRADGYVADL
jgi:hypothetical protein